MGKQSFKVGDWIIVKNYKELLYNGNSPVWSNLFSNKIGIITEVLPRYNAYKTTIHENAIFEHSDLNKFNRGI